MAKSEGKMSHGFFSLQTATTVKSLVTLTALLSHSRQLITNCLHLQNITKTCSFFMHCTPTKMI